MYKFIKEQSDQKQQQRQLFVNNSKIENGNSVRKTYEDILEMPSTSASQVRKNPVSKLTKRSVARTKCIAFDQKAFFLAASNNDTLTLQRMNLCAQNINCTDQFGWTALMMAAYGGYIDVVKCLHRRGVNAAIEDKKGNTAITLAQQKNHSEIVKLLMKENGFATNGVICISSDDDDDDDNNVHNIRLSNRKSDAYYCETCECSVAEADRKSHIASTLHRFNEKEPYKFARHYGIPDSNVGFQMLVRQGWDRESGLGPQKDGNLYPVKTTLRKARSGLGVRQSAKAKVTHFQPFDRSAVKAKNHPSNEKRRTKIDIKVEKVRNQRKDRYLRNLLS